MSKKIDGPKVPKILKKSRNRYTKKRGRSVAIEMQIDNSGLTSIQISSKFATDMTFLAACAARNIKPTRRQYAKFRTGRGMAFIALGNL